MYTKLVQSGHVVETYQYERSPSAKLQFKQRKKRHKDALRRPRRMDNQVALRNKFRRIVLSNLVGGALPYFITFTFKENEDDIHVAYAWLRQFHQKMRSSFGKDFSYIVVPEFQKRGAVHFHGLYFGLPVSALLERETRFIAKLWGLGFVDLMQTDGSQKISSYLSKYMLKAVLDKRLSGQKGFVTSRNIKRPVSSTGFLTMTSYLDEIVGVDNYPVLSREYDTMWLGRCNYKLFNL